MSPQSPDCKEHEPLEAGTSQTAPLAAAKTAEQITVAQPVVHSTNTLHLNPIALPAKPQPLNVNANKIKMRFIRRRAVLKPYNKTPLPSISCLLPVRENSYTPPHDYISPQGFDACGMVPVEQCPDELFDWTSVPVATFCNWPANTQEPTAVQTSSCWTQAQQEVPTNGMMVQPGLLAPDFEQWAVSGDSTATIGYSSGYGTEWNPTGRIGALPGMGRSNFGQAV